jgi:SET and MYND domain-containing protein 4
MMTQWPDLSTMHAGPGVIPVNDAFKYCEELIRALLYNKQMKSATVNYHLREEHFEKARYALTLLESHNLIPDVPLQHPKNDIASTNFRKSGNECFAAKQYFDALECYNKSICFAEKETENLAIGYANRSAVYFEWQQYERCLENICLAKAANYPERLMFKLENRRLECDARIKCTKRGNNRKLTLPKLSYPPHSKCLHMADCLELAVNVKYGRHIIAKRDLKVGDVVIMEKPFQKLLLEEDKYRRCANCLIENDLTLIPCPSCTLSMYCSVQCLTAAYEKFHKYECPIIDALFKLFSMTWVGAFRAIVLLIDELKSDLESFVLEMDNKVPEIYLSQYYRKVDTDKSIAHVGQKYGQANRFGNVSTWSYGGNYVQPIDGKYASEGSASNGR